VGPTTKEELEAKAITYKHYKKILDDTLLLLLYMKYAGYYDLEAVVEHVLKEIAALESFFEEASKKEEEVESE